MPRRSASLLLHQLLDRATPAEAPSDLARAYQLATEARFGFVQSLREHPSDTHASAGLRASILALVELEIRQKHADTAEALLREVDSPDPSLFTRLAAVRAEDETRRREAQRLEAIDHDLDPTVEAAPRALLVGLLVVLMATITVVAVTATNTITSRTLVLFGGVFTSAVVLGALAFRRRLMTNAFNRRLTGMMVGISALVECERIVGYASDVPVARIFATDLWVTAAGIGAVAILLRPRLWPGLVPVLIGALAVARFPERAPNIFSGSMVASLVLLGLALRPATAKRSGP